MTVCPTCARTVIDRGLPSLLACLLAGHPPAGPLRTGLHVLGAGRRHAGRVRVARHLGLLGHCYLPGQ